MVREVAVQTGTVQESRLPGNQQHGYRGRVRSGCLTCRSRKVKCDEQRPDCNNCARLKRRCVYKPKESLPLPAAVQSPRDGASDEHAYEPEYRQSPQSDPVSPPFPSTPFEERTPLQRKSNRYEVALRISQTALEDPFRAPDTSITEVTTRLVNALRRQNETPLTADNAEFEADSPSTLISRDIKLTTTMDLLTAREIPFQPLLSFFVDSVDCPAITPYDGVNWRRMKLEVVEIGMSDPAVASAIIAVSVLYKAQLYSLPWSKALSYYRLSKGEYSQLLADPSKDFGITLVVAFLLCLFATIHYETDCVFKESSEVFVKRLEAWKQCKWSHPELSSRIIVWFRLLQSTTLRGGGMGIIPENLYSVFPYCKPGIPNLRLPSDQHTDTSTHLYEMLSTPVFEFYFQLQMISSEIAKLTHYHRPRTSGVDQDEVSHQVIRIKARLNALWRDRSATHRQTPESLRSHLAPAIADPLISLIGVCAAAYHAEFVEMDRVLGDPVSEMNDSKEAMRQIREIVDDDWNAYDHGKLKPGYLRPLFLYAIECMNRDENEWAVDRLKQIKDPICRSDFFASFGKALCDAQLRKERRVTSKYFSIWYFGVPPPFM